jgi:hypothetical protein
MSHVDIQDLNDRKYGTAKTPSNGCKIDSLEDTSTMAILSARPFRSTFCRADTRDSLSISQRRVNLSCGVVEERLPVATKDHFGSKRHASRGYMAEAPVPLLRG